MFSTTIEQMRTFDSLVCVSALFTNNFCEFVVCRDGSEKEVYKEQAMHSSADVRDQFYSGFSY